MKTENKELFISTDDLRGCTPEQLRDIIYECKRDIHQINHEAALMGMSVEKPHVVRAKRKLIARCKTVLKEKTNG